jgi:hypothetical protein
MTVDPDYEAELQEIYIHSEKDLRLLGPKEDPEERFVDMSDPERTFILENDIVLEEWTPIGGGSDSPFRGTFNGGGHTITIKSFDGEKKIEGSTAYLGFFAYTDEADIKNLTIKYELNGPVDMTIVDAPDYDSYAGGVAGFAENTVFENIQVTGNFSIKAEGSGSLNMGGIAGCIYDTEITACSVEGRITAEIGGTADVGGLVGYADGNNVKLIQKSYVAGLIESKTTGSYSNAGGIIGKIASATTTVENCYAWVNVSTSSTYGETAGGIAGTSNGTISKCYAAGSVQSQGRDPYTYVGGIAGTSNDSTSGINGCMALVLELDGGPSTSTSKNVYAIDAAGSGTLSNNYSRNDILYKNRPNDSPIVIDRDGVQRAPDDFKSETLYTEASWDFSVWKFLADCDYPVLSWQDNPPGAGMADDVNVEIEWP